MGVGGRQDVSFFFFFWVEGDEFNQLYHQDRNQGSCLKCPLCACHCVGSSVEEVAPELGFEGKVRFDR